MAEGLLLSGRYRLEGRLGRGGMADVWRARDEFLGRAVAVKEVRLPPGLDEAQRADFGERMLREARAAAALPHPSIITVHDVLHQDGRPWIVMDLLGGPSLETLRVERGPLPPRRVAEIGLQLLDALCLAHDRGILHRDVKPANVLLNGDRAVLTDFGIATLAGDQRLTSAQGIVGSPGYMAPERLQDGGEAGPSSDLWSLGATLYAVVEGRRPFEKPNALAMLGAVLTEDVPPPRLAGPLGPVLVAMMARNPHLRPVPAEIRRAFQSVAGVIPDPPAVSFQPQPQPHAAYPAARDTPATVADALAVTPSSKGQGRLLLLGTAGLAVPILALAGYLLLRSSSGAPAAPASGPSASSAPSQAVAALTTAPDPCSLLTKAQGTELTGSSSASKKDANTCSWSALEIKVRFLTPQGAKTAEDVAEDTFALLKRQTVGSEGTSSDPTIKVVRSKVRDLQGLGDEAFAQDESATGLFASAQSTVWVRYGRLILQIESRDGDSSQLTQDLRDTPVKAARHALGNLPS